MKKSLVLAMAMALGVTASAYAANPFSDVPAGHWAYDSVAKLAAAGVVDGYADGAFDGDKLMTRYEMAQIVAKAMAKGANVDKLAAEFADELDTLGVRVAKLEKGADAVKITGEVRYHYKEDDGLANGNENKLRSRLWFAGQINDDWTYTAMIENQQNFDNDDKEEGTDFQRAYLNGKLGGMKVLAGRYSKTLGDKNVLDHRFDGVEFTYGKDVKLQAGFGKENSKDYDHVAYAEASTKLGVVDVMAGFYDFQDANKSAATTTTKYQLDTTGGTPVLKEVKTTTEGTTAKDKKIWAVGAGMPVAKDLKLSAIYLDGDMEDMNKAWDDQGYVATLSYKGAKASAPGSWGLVAKWYDLPAACYVDHTMNGQEAALQGLGGFEGYSLVANYTIAKNIVAQLEWYDLEAKNAGKGEEDSAETLWTQVVFTF